MLVLAVTAVSGATDAPNAVAAAEGLTERLDTFRATCDARIAEIAQARLGNS